MWVSKVIHLLVAIDPDRKRDRKMRGLTLHDDIQPPVVEIVVAHILWDGAGSFERAMQETQLDAVTREHEPEQHDPVGIRVFRTGSTGKECTDAATKVC
jgi:hypothetical protein